MKIPKATEQFIMSIIWSFAIISWVTYILVRFAGADKGILNLLIGFMTGTAATILGVYFVTNMQKKTDLPPVGTTTQETTTTTATTLPTDKTT